MLLGAGGAVIALGDTLIAAALRAGRSALSPMVQFLLEVRILHPAMAVAVGLFLVAIALIVRARGASPRTNRLGLALIALFVVQLGVGLVNVALHAPVAMQLVHLLLADLVWIALVLFGASALAPAAAPAPAATAPTVGPRLPAAV